MQTGHWYRINDGNQTFNWTVKNGVWQILPAPNGPNGSQKYSLATWCLFGDFNLKLEFRCPDMRTWTNCNSALTGPRN